MLPIFIVTNSRIMGIKPMQSFLSCPMVHYLTSVAPQKRKDQSVLPPCICLLAHLCSHSSINELLAVRRPIRHFQSGKRRIWADRKAYFG